MTCNKLPTPWELQWGHGESAVDNADAGQKRDAGFAGLQWGHGESAVENGKSKPKEIEEETLPCGHGESAVENSWRGRRLVHRRQASMGPRRIRRGKLRCLRSVPKSFRLASIGPRRIRSGKRC